MHHLSGLILSNIEIGVGLAENEAKKTFLQLECAYRKK
jgi:hypothetical protein